MHVCQIWEKGLNNEDISREDKQKEIGWRNFRMGYLDKRWKQCIPPEKDAQVWSNKAVAILLEWMVTMYNHHVSLTHEKEDKMKADEARKYVSENWDECKIPPTETAFHPNQVLREEMMERTPQEMILWQQLDQNYRLQQEDPED